MQTALNGIQSIDDLGLLSFFFQEKLDAELQKLSSHTSASNRLQNTSIMSPLARRFLGPFYLSLPLPLHQRDLSFLRCLPTEITKNMAAVTLEILETPTVSLELLPCHCPLKLLISPFYVFPAPARAEDAQLIVDSHQYYRTRRDP